MTSCTYCGSPYGETRDHVIPSSYLRRRRRFKGDWHVPACIECNSTLWDRPIFTVPERAAWLLTKYRKKYRRRLPEIADRIRHLEIVARMPLTYMAPEAPQMPLTAHLGADGCPVPPNPEIVPDGPHMEPEPPIKRPKPHKKRRRKRKVQPTFAEQQHEARLRIIAAERGHTVIGQMVLARLNKRVPKPK